MPDTPRTDLSHSFCSYCGHPPMGAWRDRAHRVCMRCEMGVVLHAPTRTAPRHDDPFLIVDRQLAVQAVSRLAELALSVEEPAGLDVPLEEFLICDSGDRGQRELAALVELAFAGAEPSNRLELRTVADPEIRLQGRVTSCGPPRGALIVLTAVAGRAALPRNRRVARNPNLAGVGGGPGQRGMSAGEHGATAP
jgi:hypothetical protein